MAYRYQIKYKKNGPLKFISHLDLNALFCRTLRRTQMPLELTQGYNPRFKVSFGPALPLGIAGWQEILDIYLIEESKPEQIKEKINMVSPAGLIITEAYKVPALNKSLSQSLCQAVYLIFLGLNKSQDIEKDLELKKKTDVHIKNFLHYKNILVEKKTKKGPREVDLRPYIQNLELISWQDGKMVIRLMIDIQYKGSINPYLVMNEFFKQFDDQRIYISQVIREQLILDSDKNCKKK